MSKNDTNNYEKIFNDAKNDEEMFPLCEVFNESEWQQLRQKFDDEKKEEFDALIQKKFDEIEQQRMFSEWKETILSKLEKLRDDYAENPSLLQKLFQCYKNYRVRGCNLPRMDQYGRVIEQGDMAIVEQFFRYKITRAGKLSTEKALERALTYVIEMHKADVPFEKIAYFVRKLDSLQNIDV